MRTYRIQMKLGRGSLGAVVLFGMVILHSVMNFFLVAHPWRLPFRITIGRNQTASSPVDSECPYESNRVNGTEFSMLWPDFTSTSDVWNLPAETTMDGHMWHPSNFSELCTANLDLNTSIHAPPRYHTKDRPTGLRMVMLGDSLMRYQFVMLVHYLHTGQWIHDAMSPNLLREDSFGDGGWSSFFHGLETYFEEDHLVCDCFHGDKRWWKTLVENQYYHDPGCHDNSVFFFAKFGSFGFRGHHSVSDITGWVNHSSKMNRIPDNIYDQGRFTWRYYDYEPFLRDVVAMLEPRPQLVIINEGLWGVDSLSNETVVLQIRDTLRSLGMVSVYKTTTKFLKKHARTPGLLPHDEMCCRIFDHCLRMDWTYCLDPSESWDGTHFRSYPNLRFTEQLLHLLHKDINEID